MVEQKPFQPFSDYCSNATPPRRLRILQNFLHRLIALPQESVQVLQNFPGLRNPVFCPVIRFSKNYIFDIYSFQGISGYKNFPGQKVSGFRFLPKSPPYSIFAYWTVSSNVLGCHMLNLLFPDAGIRFFFLVVWFSKNCIFDTYSLQGC